MTRNQANATVTCALVEVLLAGAHSLTNIRPGDELYAMMGATRQAVSRIRTHGGRIDTVLGWARELNSNAPNGTELVLDMRIGKTNYDLRWFVLDDGVETQWGGKAGNLG